MSWQNSSRNSQAASVDQQSNGIDQLLWGDSTEEKYLKQIVAGNDIDCNESKGDEAEISTLPGAIKAMDDIYVDENASIEPRYKNSSLERLLRRVKKKELSESDTGNDPSRDQSQFVENHDNDDNNTVDEMIEDSERQEETNLNNILERIPTNTESVWMNPSAAATSTKTIRMNLSQTIKDREAASSANSRKKKLTHTMNNSFSSGSKACMRDGNDSLAGNETIGKIVTRIMDSGNSTEGGEEERTLRSWTDFQPIAGSVATPVSKKSVDENHDNSSGNKFVNDDTSVGSISEEIEVFVAEHKIQPNDQGAAIKMMVEGDEATQKNTIISSLSFDGTYQARIRSTMGAMPPADKNAATNPPISSAEGEDKNGDVEKGESEPWWVKAERLPKTEMESSDETPSPQSSVRKSEAPDTPSTVRILGPASSEMDDDEFEHGRKVKSRANSFSEWGRITFLKRASIKYGSFYVWIICGALAMLVLSIVLIIAVSAKLDKLTEESNKLPPTAPPKPKSPELDNIFGSETILEEEPPLDWTYVDDEVGSVQIDLRTDSPAKYDFPQTDSPTIFSDPIEDVNDRIDPMQPDLEDLSNRIPGATLFNTDHPDFVFYYGRLTKAISERLPETLPFLEDPTSAQFRALQWVSMNPPGIEELKFRPLVQKYVLAVLYYATGGDQWLDNTGWLDTTDECEWFSSSDSLCDFIGRVIEIDLRTNNLIGTLPSELLLLSEYIKRIRVNGNSLEGTLPSFLGEMTELQRLHVHYNALSGTIPTDIGELSSTLISLRLGHNDIVGTIPWVLRNLEKLDALDLSSNKLTGTVPFFLGDLTSLKELDLSSNKLTGTIPIEFMKFESLVWLELDRNNLTGSMPTEVCSRLPLLETAKVDCNEVECWCCEGCNG